MNKVIKTCCLFIHYIYELIKHAELELPWAVMEVMSLA